MLVVLKVTESGDQEQRARDKRERAAWQRRVAEVLLGLSIGNQGPPKKASPKNIVGA